MHNSATPARKPCAATTASRRTRTAAPGTGSSMFHPRKAPQRTSQVRRNAQAPKRAAQAAGAGAAETPQTATVSSGCSSIGRIRRSSTFGSKRLPLSTHPITGYIAMFTPAFSASLAPPASLSTSTMRTGSYDS